MKEYSWIPIAIFNINKLDLMHAKQKKEFTADKLYHALKGYLLVLLCRDLHIRSEIRV